ncbi:MAG: molybdopterin biosynthesis protein [Firmicutes bacterium]|nr:molybdopterin biosynthesis protein [Candidatus Fermentithermobacillaceae bacterium]
MPEETFSRSEGKSAGRQVYLEDIPYELAREKLLKAFQSILMPGETRPVVECLGRVTAAPVFAAVSSPHYHAAAMDGVAVDASVTFGARETSPVTLRIGRDAFWVDTGDPLPPGTNAVIKVEDLAEKGEGELEVISPVAPWENVRIYGEDMVETELILPANHKLRPVDIAAVLAGGVTEVSVRRQPVVTFIPTGSELVPPGTRPAPGQIIEFNSAMVSAMVKEWGGIPRVTPIVPDDFSAILEAVQEALSESDLVLIGAGSSAGSEDYTSGVLSELGEVFVHGIATRPGKPVVLGRASGKPVIGLPGYPVSAALDMELFVKPLLCQFLGLPPAPPDTVKATLSRSVVSPMGVDEFVRVKLGKVGQRLVATPLGRGAALTTSLVRADGIVVVPRGREGFMGGREVEVQLVRPLWEILGTVVHIGSHDPVLDLLANLLREMHPEMTFSSANQGSLGGLLALRRGECHMAGTHLLDDETGTYNIPYVKKYVADADVHLVTLVYRQQGLMVRPGNPKNIRDVEDLTRPDVTFVNRQKGAGTRVLLDYALKEKGIDPTLIRGYDREEYTHTQVAAAVKSGAADVGLGIMAAARALGLDFIPWREERYDLAILSEYMEHPGVKAILEIIRSDRFKEQVQSLGGYDTRDTGRVIWTSRPDGYR